jgi:hypothetical protein
MGNRRDPTPSLKRLVKSNTMLSVNVVVQALGKHFVRNAKLEALENQVLS